MSKIFKGKKKKEPVLEPLQGYQGDPFSAVMGGYGQARGGGGYNPFAMGGGGGFNPFGGGMQGYGGGMGGMGMGGMGGYSDPFGAGGGSFNPFGSGMGGYGTSFGGMGMGDFGGYGYSQAADPNIALGQYLGQQYYGGGAFNPFDPSGMGMGPSYGGGMGMGGGRRGGGGRRRREMDVMPEPMPQPNPGYDMGTPQPLPQPVSQPLSGSDLIATTMPVPNTPPPPQQQPLDMMAQFPGQIAPIGMPGSAPSGTMPPQFEQQAQAMPMQDNVPIAPQEMPQRLPQSAPMPEQYFQQPMMAQQPEQMPQQQFQMPAGFPMMPTPPMSAAPPLPADVSAAPMNFEMDGGSSLGGLENLRRRYQMK